MTRLKSLTAKIILSILIILSFFVTQNYILFSNINYSYSNQMVSAQIVEESDCQDVSSKISNNKFSETSSGSETSTGSTDVLSPSSWTKTDDVRKENMRAGVITISDKTSFNDKCESYLLEENVDYPVGTTDSSTGNKVLFIRSKTTTTFGFKSGDIELDANSYYAVSVKYFTGNGFASFGLSSSTLSKNSGTIIKNMDSNKNWATATIYVSTSETQKTNINIELYLGTPTWTQSDTANPQSGYVFFDEVKLCKLSKSYYNEQIASDVDTYDKVQVVTEQKHPNITVGNGFVSNASFANDEQNWEIETTGESNVSVIDANANYFGTTPKTNKRDDNTKILAIFNDKNSEASGYATSDEITIGQNKIYRFSIWAKTNANSLDFSVNTKEDEINGTTYSPASITEVSSLSDVTTNRWNEYAFFVTGNSLSNIQVVLKLGLKSNNSSNDEYLFIDNITSCLISSADKETASSAGITNASLSLNPSPSLNISNGYFNDVENLKIDDSYPLDAKSFERVDSNTQNISGIVNLEENIFNSTKINFGNPSTKPNSYVYEDEESNQNVSNNVLMMYNQTNSYQTTKSTSSLSASANTCYILNVNIFTDISTQLGGANITLTDGSNVLAQICDINTQKSWKYFKIYFNNYGNEQSLTIQIGLGRKDKTAQGFAYFDNLEWNSYSGNIEEITENATTKVVNLNKSVEHSSKVILTESFDEYDVDEISETNKLNSPLLWNGEVKATTENEEEETTTLSDQDITAGILTNQNSSQILAGQTIMSDPTNNVLMIKSSSDNFYAFSNKLSYNLTSGSYYRISVKVKTINLTQDELNAKTIDGKAVPFGASIILDGFEQEFIGINTNGSFNAIDGWETYKFYINPDSDIALSLNLGLGSENGWTTGYAFFDDVEIIEMTEDEFTLNLNADQEDITLKNKILSVTTTKADEEKENTSQNMTYKESLAWLAIPTVLIALGILAAIIGFLIKKYLDNRPVKVTVKNSYDREATLLQELDHKNYKTSVNHKLKLLREELSQAEQYLKEEKEEHIKQTEAYETAKEIAEQDKSIKLEAPDKNYTNYEERIKKLERNIASIKADIKVLEEEQAKLNKKSKEMREKDLKGNEVKVVKGKRK